MPEKPKTKISGTKLLRKNFLWNLIGSTIAAFNSLFFMMIITRVNGIDDAGIFTFAFSAACVFYVIGVYSGRTFQITDRDKAYTDSDYFHTKFFTCLAMLLVSVIFCIARGYDITKFAVFMFLIFYKVLEAFSESTYAVIQKDESLHQVGKSFTIKAILSLAVFLVADLVTHDLVLASATIFLANLVVIIIYDLPRLRATSFHFTKINYHKVWGLLKRGFFAFGFTFLNLYIVQAAKFAIDVSASEDIQTYYGIVAMPATMLALFGNYIIQPFLTKLKKYLATDIRLFIRLTTQIGVMVIIFGALSLTAAWLLGIPVLQLLYGIELPGCLVPLLLIITGGIFNTLVLVLSTALTTMQRTLGQFIAYALTAILALLISGVLVANLGLFGAALSYLICMFVLLIRYIILFTICINKKRSEPHPKASPSTAKH